MDTGMDAMRILGVSLGVILILGVLWDAFETVVLPRRVSRRLRFARAFFKGLWTGWSVVGRRWREGPRRENYLSVYGPLSLVLLIGLWAAGLVLGFALVQWGMATPLSPGVGRSFAGHLYLSGTSFFTLGLGDLAPLSAAGRVVMVLEAGAGFIFLALVIGYLPVLYQAFSRRELRISMLDEWAGSPPSAVELVRRAAAHGDIGSVERLLADWEHWSAELLESHLSYPILAYFRSQHDNQSWVSALTAILDVSALVLAGVKGVGQWQARRTFAISRHAAVDLAQVSGAGPRAISVDRVSAEDLASLRELLASAGVSVDQRLDERFARFRRMYEPYLRGLSDQLAMPLPAVVTVGGASDNWQTSAWDALAGGTPPGS